jgi:hypothetical protein
VKQTLTAVIVAGACAAGLAAGTTWAAPSSGLPPQHASVYEPRLDPADFSTHIDNPYFPLPVGRRLVYKGVKDGVSQREIVTVTKRTRMTAEGIRVRIVRDVAKHGARVLEKTQDWYAQDASGNVWYLGERTAAYNKDGTVDRSGSWESGVRDGEPGIIMEANPRVPDAYRQEYAPKDEAEDTAWIVRRGGSITVPFRHFHHTLASLEAARVEPGAYDKKIYARGYGIVFERALTGESEVARLVSVSG